MSGEVFGAYLSSGGQVQDSFMYSVANVMARSSERLVDGTVHRKVCGAGGLADARNQVTAHWLDNTDARWLWFVDSDMGFAADTLERLIDSSSEIDRFAVGALCFSWRLGAPDGMGGYSAEPVPTMYGWDGRGFRAVTDYKRDSVVRVAGTGAACLLLHRSAMETLRGGHGDNWFTPVRYPDGGMLGEDLSLCYRLGEGGFGVHVDTSIKTTHAKTIWVGEQTWEALHG